MPLTTLTCPGCKVTLKPSKAVPEGKKVKCPKCGTIFVTAGVASKSTTAIQAKSRPQAPLSPLKPEVEEDAGWEVVEDDEPIPEVKEAPKVVEAFKVQDPEEGKKAPELDFGNEAKPKPKPKKTPKPALRDENDPPKKAPKQALRDEDDSPKRAPKQALRDEDDYEDEDEDGDFEEEEEYDDRPRRSAKRRNKGRAKASGSGVLLLILLICGGGFLLLAAGAGIGVYFYLNRDKNHGPDNDLLAYVPADCPFLEGADISSVMNASPAIANEFERSLKQEANVAFLGDCKKTTGYEFRDLFEYAIIATRPLARQGPILIPPARTMILKTKVPLNQNKIRDAARGATAQKHNGKTFFKITEAGATMMFMPSDRILILSNLNESGMQALVSADGANPALPAETSALIQSARQNNSLWFVMALNDNLKQGFRAAANLPVTPPDLKAVCIEIANAKGVEVSAAVSGTSTNLRLRVICIDDASAKRLASDGQAAFNKNLGGVEATVFLATVSDQELRNAFKELIKNAKFSSQGNAAELTAQLSGKSTEVFLKKMNDRRSAPVFGD